MTSTAIAMDVLTSIVDEKLNLPMMIEPGEGTAATPEGLLDWWRANEVWVNDKLYTHGALLLRGFGISEQPIFAQLTAALNEELLDYVDGNSPRTRVGSHVYTSTEYPPEFFISMHNELSYAKSWPSRLFFCSVTPAEKGGETPLADSRRILRTLDPALVEEFRAKGVIYIRNLHGGQGFGPSWMDTFETRDRTEVERYAAEAGDEIEWKADGGVRLSSIRPATHTHPVTGEEVWFNQADQFHPSTHPKEVYESMMAVYKGRENELPQYVTFGDGSEIPVDGLETIRDTINGQLALFEWQKGDLVVVDNVLVCHGRMPFEGERKTLVSMA